MDPRRTDSGPFVMREGGDQPTWAGTYHLKVWETIVDSDGGSRRRMLGPVSRL